MTKDTDQQKVYANLVARGYRDGWTPEQYLARQVAKLMEELGEVLDHIAGSDVELRVAIYQASDLARKHFDNLDLWRREIIVTYGIDEEIADCQVVLYNLAECLTEITGKPFNVSEMAVEKSNADKKRGVRNS